MPPVNQLYAELEKKGLAVLLVSFREDAALVKRVARERGYVAPVLLDASGDVTGRLYGVGGHDWTSPAARRLLEAVLELR